MQNKCDELATYLRQANHVIVFTGAGISTSSGIPDFRGPNGVWTKEQRGEEIKTEDKTSDIFDRAKPSFTHTFLRRLLEGNYIHHIVSQNVDGLHLRSGIPPEHLSEIHGNLYIEECVSCKKQYFRDYDVQGMGLKFTGAICDDASCGGKLRKIYLLIFLFHLEQIHSFCFYFNHQPIFATLDALLF